MLGQVLIWRSPIVKTCHLWGSFLLIDTVKDEDNKCDQKDNHTIIKQNLCTLASFCVTSQSASWWTRKASSKSPFFTAAINFLCYIIHYDLGDDGDDYDNDNGLPFFIGAINFWYHHQHQHHCWHFIKMFFILILIIFVIDISYWDLKNKFQYLPTTYLTPLWMLCFLSWDRSQSSRGACRLLGVWKRLILWWLPRIGDSDETCR